MSTKIRIFSVICELNPPHNGHISLIEPLKKTNLDFVIAVMSGNYVQRGTPAMFDQWSRAKAILAAGADLVVQLPLPWAVSRAETFAFGSVFLLDAMHCVDRVAFGSECGNLDALLRLRDALESPQFSTAFQKAQETAPGSTFAALQQRAAASLLGAESASLLQSPNNTLGIAYCRALRQLSSSIQPLTVKRIGAGYHDLVQNSHTFPSATQLRAILRENPSADLSPFLPPLPASILTQAIQANRAPVLPEALESSILAKLRTMHPSDFTRLPDCSEGLEQKLQQAVRRATSLEELYAQVKSKRYSHARIRRIVLSAFLDITANDTALPPPYLRVLGRTERGSTLLPILKKNASLPLVLRHADTAALDERGKHIYELECRATDLYALAYPAPGPCGLEQSSGVIIVP